MGALVFASNLWERLHHEVLFQDFYLKKKHNQLSFLIKELVSEFSDDSASIHASETPRQCHTSRITYQSNGQTPS